MPESVSFRPQFETGLKKWKNTFNKRPYKDGKRLKTTTLKIIKKFVKLCKDLKRISNNMFYKTGR